MVQGSLEDDAFILASYFETRKTMSLKVAPDASLLCIGGGATEVREPAQRPAVSA
jgi:hypothetical protein